MSTGQVTFEKPKDDIITQFFLHLQKQHIPFADLQVIPSIHEPSLYVYIP
ncbi:MAG: hypothetical protein H6765_07340 [Candidatus Peribacteria bacterium]|nr:MAG: hypothetical protein H6765_07340 [Candidatus Peribacteria bacterium]